MSIGGIFGGIAGTIGKVTDGIKKAYEFLTKPLSEVLAPVMTKVKDAVGGLLDKIPFGLGNFIKSFVNKFLDNALGFLSKTTLGGFGFMAKFMPTISKVAELAESVGGILSKLGNLFAPAQENAANVLAHRQAELLTTE
jgi:phage-related protein